MRKHEQDHEIDRKRKLGHDFVTNFTGFEDQDDSALQLTLSINFRPSTRPRIIQPQPQQQQQPPPPPPPPPPPSPPPPVLHSLLSQPPPQLPLQLSSSHPLYMPPPPLPLNNNNRPRSSPDDQPPVRAVVALAQPQPPPVQPVVGRQRVRRNPTQVPRDGKSEIITPPFAWATSRRATVHSLSYLRSKRIHTISGEVQCKRCERQYEVEYDLESKFIEVASFIVRNRYTLHDRAPSVWMNPILPTCKFCDQENSVKPLISDSKKSINWLFLLLGQMLGCCTLEQLKYFCKHTKNHRTGAKDRVLYLTYLGLCKQLEPNGPFEI